MQIKTVRFAAPEYQPTALFYQSTASLSGHHIGQQRVQETALKQIFRLRDELRDLSCKFNEANRSYTLIVDLPGASVENLVEATGLLGECEYLLAQMQDIQARLTLLGTQLKLRVPVKINAILG